MRGIVCYTQRAVSCIIDYSDTIGIKRPFGSDAAFACVSQYLCSCKGSVRHNVVYSILVRRQKCGEYCSRTITKAIML